MRRWIIWKSFVVLMVVFAAAAVPVFSQGDSPEASAYVSAKARQWVPDDFIMVERAGQFRISPDGRWVVWTKSTPDTDKDLSVSNLYLSSLTEKNKIELTRGNFKNSDPKWSRDGKLIAFTSDRPLPESATKDLKGKPASTQLWLINPFGGEPWPLTHSERGVKSFDWLDAGHLIVAAEEDPTLYEAELKEKKDNSRAIDDAMHTPPVRLFKLDSKSGEMSRLTKNDDWIEDVAASPDGHWAVAVHQRSLSYQYDQKVKPVTFLYNLETGESKQLFADGKVLPREIKWAPDSSGFYALSPYSSDPVYRMAIINQLYYHSLADGRDAEVNLDWPNGASYRYAVTPDGFIALLADGVRHKAARYTRDGTTWSREWVTGVDAGHLFDLEISKDGHAIVYNSSTASKPVQWYRASLDGASLSSPEQLTDLNPKYKNKPKARTETIHWKGARDETVEGILYYPDDYQAGKKYPLVVMTHGGPLGADYDEWSESWAYPANLYTQRGAFILKTNYHGSSDYGLKFAESIGRGNYYDLEIPDIEKGVDYLIGRGLVDPGRLGALGWSNGAILTIELTVTSPRFKVASAGAGDVEWISDWANVDFGASFDNYYFGKAPIDDPQLYIRKSPVFKLRQEQTPMLVFTGTDDRNVPPSQSWELFRNLQQLDKPVRFIVFPGEPHGPRHLSHQRRKVEEELAWFDKYLFKPGETENEAFKKDSPLGIAFKREKIMKLGLDDGVMTNGVLVPEVVKYHGMEIGRFEVTRAQFATFDKDYEVVPGTENFPANNISFRQAKDYCAWLSRKTGVAVRLGTEEEMKPIYKSAKSPENTLDYWAGYKVNPDDAARLQKKIAQLKGAAPLLKEVGRFTGVGEDDLVYDLGGNVAEWTVGKDGEGKLLGGSADLPADSKDESPQAAPAYRGFRIVKASQ